MLAVPVVIEPALALSKPSTLAMPLDLKVAELASPVISTSEPAVTTPSNCEVVDTFINPVTDVLPAANVLLNVAAPVTEIVLLNDAAPVRVEFPVTDKVLLNAVAFVTDNVSVSVVAPSTFNVLSKSTAPVAPNVAAFVCPDTLALAALIFPAAVTSPVRVDVPVTAKVFDNVAAPVTATVLLNVAVLVTAKVLLNVVAPVTDTVLLNVAAPVTARVLLNVVAPVTDNELLNVDALVTAKVSCNVVAPPTPNVLDNAVAPNTSKVPSVSIPEGVIAVLTVLLPTVIFPLDIVVAPFALP